MVGELGLMERPTQHERERHQPDTGHVRPMIEPRHAGAWRHRDSELLPEPIAAELQLLDGCRQHVLDDHEARVRRHDQPLRSDETVRDLARVLMQQRDRRHELANQAECRVDVELEVALVRHPQHVGQSRTFNVIRHDREPGAGHLDTIDTSHTRVVGMSEVRQPGSAFAQREFERRHCRQRRPDAKNLQQLAGRAVRGDDALAKAVAKERSFWPFVGERYGCHGGPRLRGATIGPDRTRFLGSPPSRCNCGAPERFWCASASTPAYELVE